MEIAAGKRWAMGRDAAARDRDGAGENRLRGTSSRRGSANLTAPWLSGKGGRGATDIVEQPAGWLRQDWCGG
jgi:hypothetical protein